MTTQSNPCNGCNGSGLCSHTNPEEHFICEECLGSGTFPGAPMTFLANIFEHARTKGRKQTIDEIEELANEREEYAPLLIDLTARQEEYERIKLLRSLVRRLRKGPR